MRSFLPAITIAMFAIVAVADPVFTEDEVRQRMIVESIGAYRGNCPCPYNRASNGSRCGKRSAWSRPGGDSPLCYPNDISDEMLRRFITQNGLQVAK